MITFAPAARVYVASHRPNQEMKQCKEAAGSTFQPHDAARFTAKDTLESDLCACTAHTRCSKGMRIHYVVHTWRFAKQIMIGLTTTHEHDQTQLASAQLAKLMAMVIHSKLHVHIHGHGACLKR